MKLVQISSLGLVPRQRGRYLLEEGGNVTDSPTRGLGAAVLAQA
jgi:hypothetical protein